MSAETLDERFAWWLDLYHRLKPEDVEPAETEGYWQIRRACGGLAGGCRHLLHGFMFNEGSMHHTVCYTDSRRAKNGRWSSPYITWREHRARMMRLTSPEAQIQRELPA